MEAELIQHIAEAVDNNLRELIRAGGLRAGQLVVIGTSTSEIMGHRIGTSGTLNAAEPIFQSVSRVSREHGLYAAFQCCEHLNRALVLEEEALRLYPLEPVSVIPVPKAGGAMASYAYRHLTRPIVVESVQAHAGMDIGSTLIGMHVKRVAVPVRPPVRMIGQAFVTMAYSRPKLIGGPRAVYTAEEAARQQALSSANADC